MNYGRFDLPHPTDVSPGVNIPVIVVLTKYDLLFNEQYRDCGHISSQVGRKEEAAKRAKLLFSAYTKELTGKYPFVSVQVSTHKVSTRKATQKQKEHEGLLIKYL